MKKRLCAALALLACLAAAACRSEYRDGSPLQISVTDLSGTPILLSFPHEQVTILNLWATWCVPCKAEIKNLTELVVEGRMQGCRIMGIALDSITPEHLKPAVAALSIPYPVYAGNADEILKKTGVSAIPATIFIDRSGTIVKRLVGYHAKEELQRAIEEVVAANKTGSAP